MHIEYTYKKNVSAFQLTIDSYRINTLTLLSKDITKISLQLEQMLDHAPTFLSNTPVILNFTNLLTLPNNSDIDAIKSVCVNYGVIPIGIQIDRNSNNRTPYSLPKILTANRNATNRKAYNSDNTQRSLNNKYIDYPVRSGQQIYSKANLVVSASVSAGAELFAEGSIHVYGMLRGKAFAGISGDTTSRIFASGFSSELVSINGSYLLSNLTKQKKFWGKIVCIKCIDQQLKITSI